MDRLLVDGYVRNIEKILINKIIPIEIYHICFDFYFSSKFMFYLASIHYYNELNESKIENTLSIANIDTKKQWTGNVFKISNPKINILDNDENNNDWTVDSGGICFARNIKIPNIITSKLSHIKNRQLQFNNIVFQVGGLNKTKDNAYIEEASEDCSALIINSHQFSENKNQTIDAYRWALPSFPSKLTYNYILYSNKQNALYSFGGSNARDLHLGQNFNTIHKLSFNINEEAYCIQNEKEWNWMELDIKMNRERGNLCGTMMDNENKIMIAGGYLDSTSILKTVDILNCDTNKWIDNIKELNYARMDAGIYYCDVKQMCYVGGGYADHISASRFVECYDIKKNVWNVLPKTGLEHDMNPMIWIEDNNLLHIMSVQSNGMEYIDLRESKKWITSVKNLEQLFNVKFDYTSVTCSRIVGN
eukprot:501149_1